jgi:hypothetical protein
MLILNPFHSILFYFNYAVMFRPDEKTFNHKIDYENFKILDRATSNQMVLIKEMLHIDKLKPSLNKQKQSYYTFLLLGSKIKKKTKLLIFNLWLFILSIFKQF